MAIPLINLQEFTTITKPLIIFIIGITIYALFVFKFYKFVATKKIFKLNLEKYNNSEHGVIKKFFSSLFYVIENIILMPILIFFWFIIFAAMMAFMSKNTDAGSLLLISAALVGAIRITTYYSEDLSKDLAKLIPFALLGVFLIDISYFSFESSLTTLFDLGKQWITILHYLIFIVILEFVIRIAFVLLSIIGITFEEELEEQLNEK